MATVITPSLGKTEFVRDHMKANPKCNVGSINEAWQAGKNEGSISESLIHKVRAEFKHGTKNAGRKAVKKGSVKTVKTAPKRRVIMPTTPALQALMSKSRPKNPSLTNVKHAVSVAPSPYKTSSTDDRSRVLDRIEAEIDEVIFILMGLGGFAEVESALRAARRLLTRSHAE